MGWAGKPDPHAGRDWSGMIRTPRAHAPESWRSAPPHPGRGGKPGPGRLAPRRPAGPRGLGRAGDRTATSPRRATGHARVSARGRGMVRLTGATTSPMRSTGSRQSGDRTSSEYLSPGTVAWTGLVRPLKRKGFQKDRPVLLRYSGTPGIHDRTLPRSSSQVGWPRRPKHEDTVRCRSRVDST
jgi:hypothetical protein